MSKCIVGLIILYFSKYVLKVLANCDSEIYCRGPILEKIQMSGIFTDSKHFVDMPTSQSKAIVLKNFAALGENATISELRAFVSANFHRAGYEMKIFIPKDWKENPKLFQKLNNKDGKLKVFAGAIHSKWKALARRFDQKRLCPDCLGTSLKLPYPFIVPGGRFREFYYWDSYWILEGLYVSEMCSTASGMVENMLVMIDEIGFIPNGARTYYMNRSQPPVFSLIVSRYMEECITTLEERKEFLRRVLPLLEKEYNYWMKERLAEIIIPGYGNVSLNVYRTEHWIPRPESFVEDRATASLPQFDSELKKQQLYQNIASAAESGWDFSSRWLILSGKANIYKGLEDIQTVMLIPTDLNVFMLKFESLLSEFFQVIDNPTKDKEYQARYQKRQKAMDVTLKRLENGSPKWKDFDMGTMKSANRSFYISDISPIWFSGVDVDSAVLDQIIKENHAILFKYPGGIPVSEDNTGQQWDFPNVWAPMQHLFIDSLLRADNGSEGIYYKHALNISQRFINSVYCGYELFGQVFEKYHAINIGYPGGGGEYIVQEGFGWTNGVVLWILDKFGDKLTAPRECFRIEITSISHGISQANDFKGRSSTNDTKQTYTKRISTILLNILLNIFLMAKLL